MSNVKLAVVCTTNKSYVGGNSSRYKSEEPNNRIGVYGRNLVPRALVDFAGNF